uniref:HECT domain-containing protein n=1 Tax=Cyprinodon variegatus TaxID=28743 RepID=A0A3Q2C971_CYPVA
ADFDRKLRFLLQDVLLVRSSFLHGTGAQLGSNRTSVVRCGRQKYERQYPVLLVQPDGSTVSIRYPEPRRILLVSEEEEEEEYTSTCSLTLTLPRDMEDEEDFKNMMYEAIIGSLGFGKV